MSTCLNTALYYFSGLISKMITLNMLPGAWTFRGFIWSKVKRELQSKWHGIEMGAIWIVALPFIIIIIFTIVFAEVIKSVLSHCESKLINITYLRTGLLTWEVFSEFLVRCITILFNNTGSITKINSPMLFLLTSTIWGRTANLIHEFICNTSQLSCL